MLKKAVIPAVGLGRRFFKAFACKKGFLKV
jgi:UTP-glucose-1-phosphate uridylyltransferase